MLTMNNCSGTLDTETESTTDCGTAYTGTRYAPSTIYTAYSETGDADDMLFGTGNLTY